MPGPENVHLREVAELAEALELAPLLDRRAEEALADFRDDPLPPGVARRFLERAFGAPETLLLVAETAPGAAVVGAVVVGPFEDPLSLERLPMVLLLFVSQPQRHQGLARRLVNEAAGILSSRGFEQLAARVGHNDDALISMGERWGFVRSWELMLLE